METILGFLYGMYTYSIIMHDWASYCAEVWECEQSNFDLAPRVVNNPGNKSISQGSGKYREIGNPCPHNFIKHCYLYLTWNYLQQW